MMKQNRPVHQSISRWLAIGVVMLLVQILLGGITRLTGSGLSITEWQPLLGSIPPLNERAWRYSFEQYQQIAQFKKLNSGFTLDDYRHIFFWEWLHREWARLMAMVFIVPFCIFLWKRMIPVSMTWPLTGLFVLGGLQGAIGWIMVKSGLNDTDVRVDHLRLALHFSCALLLLCYLFWLTLRLTVRRHPDVLFPKSFGQLVLIFLVSVQMVYGAFMAGTHAALSAPTWPDINGAFIPDNLFTHGRIFHAICYDPVAIQFIHRSLAYLIAFVILIRSLFFAKGAMRWIPLLLVCLQISLGVLALTNSMFRSAIYFAVLHQFVGILLLLSVLVGYYLEQRTGNDNCKSFKGTCYT